MTRPVRLGLLMLLSVLGVAGSSTTTLAQTDGSRSQLTVTVVDSTGASVADASVVLTRGTDRRVMTTAVDGTVRFTSLGVGEWTIVVTRDGFNRWQHAAGVTAGNADVRAELAVAGFASTVQVESTSPVTQIPLDTQATGGSRLDIPVRSLPASLFLVGHELMQERGARSVEEGVALAVGMQSYVGDGSIPYYTTRGWDENNISMMRDGIRQNTMSQSSRPVDSFILDRIEILKGPASLLYGEGAIGGAINVVSKWPSSQLGVDSLLSYGSFGDYRAGLGVNAPLRKNVFFRVDASRTGSDGYVGDSPRSLAAAAGSLQWLPTSNSSVKAIVSYSHDDAVPYYGTPFIDGRLDPRTLDLNYNMQGSLARSTNRWTQIEADVLFAHGWQLHNQFFAATHQLDWRNFEGYSYDPVANKVDVGDFFLIWRNDLLLGNRLTMRNSTSVAGRQLGVAFGVETQNNDLDRAGTPPGTSITRELDPFHPQPHFDPGLQYVPQRQVQIGTNGVFAEGVLDASSRLKLVGGLRWEAINLDYTPFATKVTASQDYTPTTGRVGAVFQLSPAANVYGSFTNAVQPTSQLVSLSGSQQQFSLVPGRQFEVGMKGGGYRGRLDATFAYFDIEKRDILLSKIINGVETNQQVGRQSSHGIELALAVKPTSTLRIAGDIAVTAARFEDYTEIIDDVNISRDGNMPARIPNVIWNIAPIQRIGRADVTATLRHVGRRWVDDANTLRARGYTTLDAAIGYRVRRGSHLSVRMRNLTDEIYSQPTWSTAMARLEPRRSVEVMFTTSLLGF